MRRYRVTCLSCGESDVLTIDELNNRIDYFGAGMNTNFLSARFRKDREWGFECRCGNDNRLARSEGDEMDKLVAGSPDKIAAIAASLKIEDAKQFRMVAA